MAKLIGRWIDKTTITNFHMDHTDSYELGNLWITGDSTFTGDSSFLSDASISGNLKVDGTVQIGSTISIDSSRLVGSGDIFLNPSGSLKSTSDSTFENNVDVEGRIAIRTIDALSGSASIFLTYDGTAIKSRTTDQVRSDIGAASFTGTANYLPKIDSDGTGLVDSRVSDDGTDVSVHADATILGRIETRFGSDPATEYTHFVLHSDSYNANSALQIQFDIGDGTSFPSDGAGYCASIAGVDVGNYDGRLDFRVNSASSHNDNFLTVSETRMVVNHLGNVGIGTLTPDTYKFECIGHGFFEGNDGFDSSGEDAVVYLGDAQNYVRARHSVGVQIGTYLASPGITLTTPDGYVGIKTSAPVNLLHLLVNNSTDVLETADKQQIIIEQDGTGDAGIGFELTGGQRWSLGIDNNDSSKFKLRNITGATDALSVSTNSTLTVGGDSTISGNLKVDGTAQIGSGTLTIDSSRIISSGDLLLNPVGILSVGSDASFSGDTTLGDVYVSGIRGPGFRRSVALSLYGSDETVSVGGGTVFFPVTADLNGWRLVDVIATVDSTGDTSSTDIMVRRKRDGSTAYMLSTAVTLSSEYYARDGIIDTNYDDIATGDNLFVYVDSTEITAPVGLSVGLTFEN